MRFCLKHQAENNASLSALMIVFKLPCCATVLGMEEGNPLRCLYIPVVVTATCY